MTNHSWEKCENLTAKNDPVGTIIWPCIDTGVWMLLSGGMIPWEEGGLPPVGGIPPLIGLGIDGFWKTIVITRIARVRKWSG